MCFLGPHPQHMKVPRLGVKLELQLPAYTTAMAMPDPSNVCDLHHSSQQCQILNPLSKAMDQTESPWRLVRFVSTEPQQELPPSLLCSRASEGIPAQCLPIKLNIGVQRELTG